MTQPTKKRGNVILSNDLIDKIVKLYGLEGTEVYRIVIDATWDKPLQVSIDHRGTSAMLDLDMADLQDADVNEV